MDLENFPTSESAKRMLNTVTNCFYERSYVGKWIYQVMGREMDDAIAKYNELQLQIFPETATWGIVYHEQKYGIPINPALPLEERRAEIIRRRDIHSPMNPARIEEIVKGLTNAEVEVTENVVPYTFAIDISTDGNTEQLNYSNIVRTVRNVKPSHLSFYAFFSAATAVNLVIETSATAKWPLLAGEELSGTRPVSAHGGKISEVDVYSDICFRFMKQSLDFAGTKPDINAVAALRTSEVFTGISGQSIKKISPMPSELPAGVHPDENMEYLKDDIVISGKAEGRSKEFAVLAPGAEPTGMYPDTKMLLKNGEAKVTGEADGLGKLVKYRLAGEETESAAVNERGIGAEVSGEGIQILHQLCGEEFGDNI